MCADMVSILLLCLHALALTFHFVLTSQSHIYGSVQMMCDCSHLVKARSERESPGGEPNTLEDVMSAKSC